MLSLIIRVIWASVGQQAVILDRPPRAAPGRTDFHKISIEMLVTIEFERPCERHHNKIPRLLVISCYFLVIIVIGVYLLETSEQITGFIDVQKIKG